MRPRTTRLLKWTGVTVSVLLSAAFVASLWWIVDVSTPGGRGVWIGSGAFNIGSTGLPRDSWHLTVDRDYPFAHTKWWFSFKHIPAGEGPVTILTPPGEPPRIAPASWFLHIPLWVPALLAMLAAFSAWRLEARSPTRQAP